jgi:hypothetical protein
MVFLKRARAENEWDPLEAVIVGNPTRAQFPTPNSNTHLAEFPDGSSADIDPHLETKNQLLMQQMSCVLGRN